MINSTNSGTQAQGFINDVIDLVEANRSSIDNLQTNSVIGHYYAGKHRKVFDLTQYPDYIIKMGSLDEGQQKMLEAIQKGAAVAQEKNLFRCFVPSAQMAMTQSYSIWVEQKLKGIYDANEAKEFADDLFSKLDQDPVLRAKWIEIFGQAAEFIASTGYHDVDWRNLLLMEDGVGFIDFECVVRSTDTAAAGLLRLLELAPLEAFDAIFAVAEKYHLQSQLFQYACSMAKFVAKGYTQKTPYSKAVEMLKEIRREEISLNSTIHRHHAARNITNPRTKVDPSNYQEGSLEWKIIDRFNNGDEYSKGIEENRLGTTSSTEIRKLFWQPFIWNPEFTHKEFESALTRLKSDGVIASWTKRNGFQSNCDEYNIYF